MYEEWKAPKIGNQFEWEKVLKEQLRENPNSTINIDDLDNWHLEKLIQVVTNSKLDSVSFCSRWRGRLVSMAYLFKFNFLWYIDTELKVGRNHSYTEQIGDKNYLTVSRF